MGYRNLQECVHDLERTGQLVRIETEIDPRLQAAEIQRRVYQAQGPALFMHGSRVAASRWSAICSARGSGPVFYFATRSKPSGD
jgi:4-hydroxy-3-polyprenylbenzoate decarboxylase